MGSWEREDFSIYGRFDLAWDGVSPPKLLEYNADTPTSLLESAVVQWYWLQDVAPEADQLNSLHERLVEAWKLHPAHKIHFTCMEASDEDVLTTQYLRETAQQAGKDTEFLPLSNVGWDAQKSEFIDANGLPISALFKLYPWEWMWMDQYSAHLPGRCQIFCEPIWKMLFSNKGLLPILWELFPDHPNLLPAYDSPEALQGNYVQKPKLSREGANVTIIENGQISAQQTGAYTQSGSIYQAIAPLPQFSGMTPICGLWMVQGDPAGLGIREENQRITSNLSRFVPHLIR
jgi:glutathionylspermidine synthase